MKKLISALVLMCTVNTILPQNEGQNWKGYVQPDYRLNMHNGAWLWNENRLSLGWSKSFEDKARLTTDIWFRTMGNPSDPNWIKLPEVREAKIEVYDFLIPKLDVSFGRQRIKWGTADKVNPIDNLNPHDLEDIWDFGRHKPSDALVLKYFPDDKTKIEACICHFFKQ